jgi:hypothetical protein
MRKLSRGNADLKLAALALAIAFPAFPRAAAAQEREVHQAQAAFERARVARLPWSRERAFGPCDEIVGRFCYRHEAGADRPIPPEPEGVAAARDSLLAVLDAAAGRNPADGWTAGQRVRYRIEAGRPAEAIAVAMECGAEPWWCAALEGAARHAAEDFAAAERAFDRALGAMPADERERWTDVAPILDADSRRIWRGLGPGAREAFARQLWWAADPLWSVPGNERRTEHLARHVWDRMQEDAASAYDVSWGADLRELLVRYGWPAWWERVRTDVGRLGGSGRPGVVAHDPPGAKRFVPALAAIADPAVAGAAEWPLGDPTPPATYAPSYAPRFLSLEPQIARFRREDGAVVAVGWAPPRESPEAEARSFALDVLASEGPDRPFVAENVSATADGGSLGIAVPWPRAVLSLEARGAQFAGRWRAGIELSGARSRLPAISDLLLLASPAVLPGSLEEAIPRARGSALAASGERLGVFWEAYPPEEAVEEPVAIALAIRGREADPGALRWSETFPPGARVVPRAVALQLPALPPGDYVLQVEIAWPRAGARRALREFTIVR